MNDLKKWIRLPGKNQKPGEGSWQEVRGEAMQADFARCQTSLTLPVAWEVPEESIVKDARGKEPNYVIRPGLMVHQFHRIAVPIFNGPEGHRMAQRQLMHLLKSRLVIEGEFEHVTET